MEGTKSPLASLGVMGPLVGIVVWALNQWVFKGTEGVTTSEVTEVIDTGATLWTAVTAIYGRVRASKKVTLTGS